MSARQPLWLIKLLRQLPHTTTFDRHLTDCAALAVLYHPFNGADALTWRHVLRIEPLPPFIPHADAERPDSTIWPH